MYIKLAADKANILALALIAIFDDGSGNATIAIYTGSIPATPLTAVTTQTLLGTLTCSDPVGTATDNVITFGTITQDSAADASGTAAWARIFNADGDAVFDVDVTNAAGTGVIKLNTTTIVAGGPISITSFVINVGS